MNKINLNGFSNANDIIKGGMPIGTVSKGYRKVSETKWEKVEAGTESTKKESSLTSKSLPTTESIKEETKKIAESQIYSGRNYAFGIIPNNNYQHKDIYNQDKVFASTLSPDDIYSVLWGIGNHFPATPQGGKSAPAITKGFINFIDKKLGGISKHQVLDSIKSLSEKQDKNEYDIKKQNHLSSILNKYWK